VAYVTMFMDGLMCKWRDSSEAEGLLKVVASEYTGTDMDGGGGIGVLVAVVPAVVPAVLVLASSRKGRGSRREKESHDGNCEQNVDSFQDDKTIIHCYLLFSLSVCWL